MLSNANAKGNHAKQYYLMDHNFGLQRLAVHLWKYLKLLEDIQPALMTRSNFRIGFDFNSTSLVAGVSFFATAKK